VTFWRPQEREQDLHEACAEYLWRVVLPPAKWTCIALGAIQLSGPQRAKLSRMGVQASWPDFIVVHNGIYGLELKRPGGRLSVNRLYRTRRGTLRERIGQETMFEELQAAGMAVRVCMSLDDVKGALHAWGVPARRST